MDKFEERFGNVTNQDQVVALQRKLEPHLLRRIKEDVATDIPSKEETIIDIELTTLQKQYYRAIFDKVGEINKHTGRHTTSHAHPMLHPTSLHFVPLDITPSQLLGHLCVEPIFPQQSRHEEEPTTHEYPGEVTVTQHETLTTQPNKNIPRITLS